MKRLKHHRQTCHRHKRFEKHGQALTHLVERLRANEVEAGSEVFRCTHCRGWHVGSPLGGPSLERLIREGAMA